MRQLPKSFKHQDIKQKEPPQKYRLGTISNTKILEGFKIDLSPPVTLYYCSFQGDNSVVVLCLGVKTFCAVCGLCMFIILVKFRELSGHLLVK